jgi:hypothetical protein
MGLEARPQVSAVRQRSFGATVAAIAILLPLLLAVSVAPAETRGYVISWFATATYNPGLAINCPRTAKDPSKVAGIGNLGRPRDRALVDGKPVPPDDFPDAVVTDPNIETVVGKYAYGFDLGGKPENKFIDPETHQKVDNQLWRAIGCNKEFFTVTPPRAAYPEEEAWMQMVDSAPGYAIRISGADLNHDGPVTVTLDRTTRHLERDATGDVRSDVTYVLDPSPRSHNVLTGQITSGVLTIAPGSIWLEGEAPFYVQIDLQDAHMRMRSAPSGKLVGYWGGYTDWHKWAYMCSARPGSNCDPVGQYRALEKMADADPDPVTGQNRLISTTWRLEAVPAFLATPDGSIVAQASTDGLGGRVAEQMVATAAKAEGDKK